MKMLVLITLSFATFFAALVALWYYKYLYFCKHMQCFPKIKQLPVVGGALEFSSTTVLYKRLLELRKELGMNFWTMLGPEPVLFTTDPKLVKALLTSQIHLDKSRIYTFFHRWIGLGLLTSTGEKWKSRRKLLTPAFHFKILEEFSDIFNGCSETLVKNLSQEVGEPATEINKYIALCSFDGICETAMGVRVNAQLDSQSKFVSNVREMTVIPFERQFRIMENFYWTYFLTKNYWRERSLLKQMHQYTISVIRQRQKEFSTGDHIDEFGGKKKLAFLDLLLNYSMNDPQFSEEDIREEVDTFMFEGHDTTTSGISFALYLLSQNPNEQDKVFAEIKNIFSDDVTRAATFKDFQEMKYLDLVIKESLRIHAAVPLFGRELPQELEYDGIVLPKGLTVLILAFIMNKDPNLYPDPDVFKPERFLENQSTERNTFSYVPFSAGPRNCIGQKFAMLAMKSTISKVLRNFELLPVKHNLELALESILKSKNGIPVKLIKRQW